MKMHVLSGGRLRMRKSVYLPAAEKTETIELPVTCYLIRHEQGNILFDTGCHPSVAENAEDRWGSMAKVMVPINAPHDNLITQLDSVGLKPDDIDVVINSHFHSDHCGCNEFFKRATIFCHLFELEAAQAEDGLQKGYIPKDWKQTNEIKTITGQYDLLGNEKVVLLPLPGHTAGMIGAMVNLDKDGSFLLASDAVPMKANLDLELNPKNTWNADQSLASMSEVKRIQAGGAQVLFGHDDEQWQSMRKGAAFYE